MKRGDEVVYSGERVTIISISVRNDVRCYSLSNGLWAYEEEISVP